jgi:hypothetical protein
MGQRSWTLSTPLVFLAYDHAIHPEFFTRYHARTVEDPRFRIVATITPHGHTFLWTDAKTTIFEVMTPPRFPWPHLGCLVQTSFEHGQRAKVTLPHGIEYQMGVVVEEHPPEVFRDVQAELIDDGAKRGLLFYHTPMMSYGCTPISTMTVDRLPRALAIYSVHTDPENFVVRKTQSLIEWPD